jgi:arginine/ornithine N-succinyltransferase beta subunit
MINFSKMPHIVIFVNILIQVFFFFKPTKPNNLSFNLNNNTNMQMLRHMSDMTGGVSLSTLYIQ